VTPTRAVAVAVIVSVTIPAVIRALVGASLPLAKLGNLVRYYRRGGWYEVVLRFSARRWLSDRLFLVSETQILELVELNVKAREDNLRDYSCAEADATAIDALLACSPAAMRTALRRSFAWFFAEGARCYVVIHAGRVIGYVWVFSGEYVLTFDNYGRRNLTIPLDDRSVFIGNAMIEEDYHLRGLFQLLIRHAVRRLPPDTRVYSAADRTDDRSLLSHERIGFVRRARILCVTVLGIARFFRRDSEGQPWRVQPASDPVVLTAAR
jgi:hypothetical protein